ncbi:MAG: glycosyltransferase family 2 protein [Alphaproteobacteria bacterium]|nr:glycosyltransferase family 2 protein [Alphaproteobacteria bacterium]
MSEHVAICIITYRRPEGLTKLLASLAQLKFESIEQPEMTVVIVDNDAEGSSRKVLSTLSEDAPWALHYTVEKEQGIPFARNRCLDIAMELQADHIAFIDDDEYCAPNWIEQLLLQKRDTGADVVWGPVTPVFEGEIPKWMEQGKFFTRQQYPNGAVLQAAATNNVLFSSYMVRDRRLRFNTAMRYTGGTDHLFFSKAAQLGYDIVWAENAVVWEDTPSSRTTEKWLCKRYLRQGNTHSLTEMQLKKGMATKLRLFAQGCLRVTLGAVSYPLTFFTPKSQSMKIKKALFRGAGMLSALFNYNYQEYKA